MTSNYCWFLCSNDIESLSPSLRIEDDGVIGTIKFLKKWKGFTKVSQSLVPAKEVAALMEFGVPQEATYKVFCEFVLVLFFPLMSELYLSQYTLMLSHQVEPM